MTLLIVKIKDTYIVSKEHKYGQEEEKAERSVIKVNGLYFHPVGKRYDERRIKSFLITAEKNQTELLYAPQVEDISELVNV